jgi:replicative DNA helicase
MIEAENKEEPFEFQLLSLAMKQRGAITKFVNDLKPDDVGLVHGQRGIYEIFQSMLNYHDKTGLDIVDPIAFKSWLQTETDIYEALGGFEGVDKFVDHLLEIDTCELDAAVEVVKFRAKKRRQLDKAQELLQIIAKKSDHSIDDLDKIQSITEQIKDLQSDLNYDPLESVTTAYDIMEHIDDLWEIPPFLPTQFKNLNRAMGYSEEKGGFLRGGVHAVVAISGQGKSVFSRSLCNYWLDSGYRILYINFEEPRDHWERTLMTQITETNVYEQAEKLTSVEMGKLSNAFRAKLSEWGDRLMVRHDPDSLFFEDLDKWLRDIIGNDRKPDVVVIDTIQSLFTKSGGKARWGEFEQIMVRLEQLAKDMEAVFIITSQQNNNALKEKREVMNQSDVGGSVTIAQKATVTLILTPLKVATGDESLNENLMQVQMPKNRITGQAFSDSPPVIKYVDSLKSYVPYEVAKEDSRYDTDFVDEDLFGDGIY